MHAVHLVHSPHQYAVTSAPSSRLFEVCTRSCLEHQEGGESSSSQHPHHLGGMRVPPVQPTLSNWAFPPASEVKFEISILQETLHFSNCDFITNWNEMAIFGIPQERKCLLFLSVGKTKLTNNPEPPKSLTLAPQQIQRAEEPLAAKTFTESFSKPLQIHSEAGDHAGGC